MTVYKDEKQGTWYTIFRYADWTGKKKQKMKRGFRTKRDALAYENEFKNTNSQDMDMMLASFVQVYFEDKKNELKPNSVRNKKHMIEKHILPYFGERKMNEITPAEIIQWQNRIQEIDLSKTYERMLQNQINALFNHAQRIYNLKDNPCKKVKRMGNQMQISWSSGPKKNMIGLSIVWNPGVKIISYLKFCFGQEFVKVSYLH